ncbi:MAG: hypothetical protein MJ157_05910 [Clostridia bacterium]|nr:hypothetical protein [Clostridia bacterium]
MGNNRTKLKELIYDLEGYESVPKWEVLFYSANPDGTISLTIKDNREKLEEIRQTELKELAEQSQEAANDNNN